MEMPNTVPNALTQGLLEDKYQIAAQTSWQIIPFLWVLLNDNYEEVMKTICPDVCGNQDFYGLLYGKYARWRARSLGKRFANAPCLIATHCEDEPTVRHRTALFKEQYGENVPYDIHALIRNEEACYKSSSMRWT